MCKPVQRAWSLRGRFAGCWLRGTAGVTQRGDAGVKGSEVLMARWRLYQGGHRLLKWQVGPGAWLPPGCRLAGFQPQEWLWPKMLCWQEQARGPGKGAGIGRPPAHPPRVCEGAGHVCPANNLAPTHQPGFGHSLPLPLPSTQSCSFGSTDGIKTAVSVGPRREGMVASVPKDHACLKTVKSQLSLAEDSGVSWATPPIEVSPVFSPQTPQSFLGGVRYHSLSHTQLTEYSFFGPSISLGSGVQASPGSVPGIH